MLKQALDAAVMRSVRQVVVDIRLLAVQPKACRAMLSTHGGMILFLKASYAMKITEHAMRQPRRAASAYVVAPKETFITKTRSLPVVAGEVETSFSASRWSGAASRVAGTGMAP